MLFKMMAKAAMIVVALLLSHPADARPIHQAYAQPVASSTGPIPAETRKAEQQAAWRAAAGTAIRGPASVSLLEQAKLALPDGMVFIPQAEAARLSSALGNRPGPEQIGIVTTFDDTDQWMVVVRFTKEGYIRDDDARDLKPEDVLANLRDGTAEANKERVQRGFPELELLGWTQPPAYDAALHRLAWAMAVKRIGAPEDETGVNFNTRALGRDGYFSLNLITGQDTIDGDRSVSAKLLSSLEYNEGKRYADFTSSTDRVAEYGLAALLGVVAAKKLGLIAVAGAFAVKFAKVGLFALLGLGVALKRLFRRKPTA